MNKPIRQIYVQSLIQHYESVISEWSLKASYTHSFDSWYQAQTHVLKLVIEDLHKLLKNPQLFDIVH